MGERPTHEIMAELFATGLSLDQHVLVGELLIALGGFKPLTPRQARNRRYYEKRLKASETSELRQIETISDAGKGVFPPYKKPPLSPNKTPEMPSASLPPTENRATRLPASWNPTEDLWQKAKAKLGLDDETLRFETNAFRDHFWSAPKARGMKLDWGLTWLNWMREAFRRRGHNRNGHGPPARMSAAERKGAESKRVYEEMLKEAEERESDQRDSDQPALRVVNPGAH